MPGQRISSLNEPRSCRECARKQKSRESCFWPATLVLVRCAARSRADFAREENQGRPDQAGAPKHPEAIEKAQKRRLLLNDVSQLSLRMHSRVGSGESAVGKMPRQRSEPFAARRIIRSYMSHQNGLVILRSPRKKRGYERDPETSTLVSEQIGQARSLVVFILGQIGICQLAHRNEQRSDA